MANSAQRRREKRLRQRPGATVASSQQQVPTPPRPSPRPIWKRSGTWLALTIAAAIVGVLITDYGRTQLANLFPPHVVFWIEQPSTQSLTQPCAHYSIGFEPPNRERLVSFRVDVELPQRINDYAVAAGMFHIPGGEMSRPFAWGAKAGRCFFLMGGQTTPQNITVKLLPWPENKLLITGIDASEVVTAAVLTEPLPQMSNGRELHAGATTDYRRFGAIGTAKIPVVIRKKP